MHAHTHVYVTHDCCRWCRTRSAPLFLAISFCVLLFRTWVRCKILNCTSFLHRSFFFSFRSFSQPEEGSRLWGCKLEHITVFMESEFGCKMFLRFVLLDPVQSVLIMHIPHIILPHYVYVYCFHCSIMGLVFCKILVWFPYLFLIVMLRVIYVSQENCYWWHYNQTKKWMFYEVLL